MQAADTNTPIDSNTPASGANLTADEPTDYERIHAVLTLTRKVAINNYFEHLEALLNAPDGNLRMEARRALEDAQAAAEAADKAFQSAVRSEAIFRRGTTLMATGQIADAQRRFLGAGEHLVEAAQGLREVATYAPKSRFFQRAINLAAKTDEVASKIEASAVARAERFAAGMAAFAKRIDGFARMVAQTPKRINEIMREAAVTAARATIVVAAMVSGGAQAAARAAIDRGTAALDASVDAAHQLDRNVKTRAWDILDQAADVAAGLRDRVSAATQAAAIHGRASLGLAGGVLALVKDSYAERVNEARMDVMRAKLDTAEDRAALRPPRRMTP